MKKVFYLSFVASILMFSSCGESAKYQSLQNSKDSLQHVLNVKNKEVNEYLMLINQIEENFEKIKAAENEVTVVKEGASPSMQERVQANIEYINKLLADNRAKIEELSKYKSQVGGLQSSVTRLRRQLEEREAVIARLQAELAEKNAIIRTLDSTVVQMSFDMGELMYAKQEIEYIAIEQDAELHTAFYMVGTLRDLRNKGVNIKKGNLNPRGFTQIDIRDVTTIELNSKSGRILSLHPKGSYKMTVVDKKAVLEITNPAAFWSITRYLVVRK